MDFNTPDYTLWIISLGTALLGAFSGIIGSFATIRHQSLLGDAVSHAALPGIVLAFLIMGVKDPLVLLLGALFSGLLAALWITGLTGYTRIKQDSALGIVLSVFFGFGVVLLTVVQKLPVANKAGLEGYLFGQAATLLFQDVAMIMMAGILMLTVMLLLWKQYKLVSFDPVFAKTLGIPVRFIELVINFSIILIIVTGLQAVGVILMSGLIIAPAIGARQWVKSLHAMVLLSALIGVISGVSGTLISGMSNGIPTGPAIVLVAIGLSLISLTLAPERGVLIRYIRQKRQAGEVGLERIVEPILALSSHHDNIEHPHEISLLRKSFGMRKKQIERLESMGVIRRVSDTHWAIGKEVLKRKSGASDGSGY